MATDFNLDATVDYVFAAETDADFLKRFLEVMGKCASNEQRCLIHRTKRNGVSVYERLYSMAILTDKNVHSLSHLLE